ncbi:MAG: SAM-dependent methyltransferase, partial [Thiotrichaceae bacterium]
MKITKSLPEPSAFALEHSQKLQQCIYSEIESQQGSISFRRYMEMALYEPGLGYYVAGKRKLGEGGDFITAPEVSPLFSQCIANQCIQILESLDNRNILEFGAGSGTMAADILLHLEVKNCLPDQYYILDLSPELKALQRTTLEARCPHLLPLVKWLSTLPNNPFSGVILANEVLDAMPVEMFQVSANTVYQKRVAINDDNIFSLIDKEPQSEGAFESDFNQVTHGTTISADYGSGSSSEYSSEFNPNINTWVKQLESTLEQGLILLIDYGYTRSEYYHPDRDAGTLICHYQHLVHNDFFWHPGLQDITANVDFTHVAEAADNSGLIISGFTSQAAFLTGCGLEDLFVDQLNQHPDQ